MGSLGRPLGPSPRGPFTWHSTNNALLGVHRSTLRTISCRTFRRQSLEVLAFGGDPYEPLEKAINVINKILSVGESKSKQQGANNGNNGGGQRDRWVQFDTVASSSLSLQDLTIEDTELDRESTSRLLQEYLSLPVEEYSLLDPKWVVRETEQQNGDKIIAKKNSFRVSVPLQDMLGVDICPQVSIEALPDPLNSQVTLLGTRAILGSPGLDEAFKLKLVAVMRCKKKDRHLPGRPVQRLKQWAAKRRGNVRKKSFGAILLEADGPYSESNGGGVGEVNLSEYDDKEDEDEDEDEIESSGFSIPSMDNEENSGVDSRGSSTSFRFSTDLSSGEDDINSSLSTTTTTAKSTNSQNNRQSVDVPVAAQAPLLDCKVQIHMAVRVPGALRVVPNRLLGYAGSVITKTVLNAVLPNFLQLLSKDFKQWVAGGDRKETMIGEDDSITGGSINESGSLFRPLISTGSGSERPEI